MVSVDPPMFFFILVLHDPLSFLILGFCDSPQLFILTSHFFQAGCQGLDLLCSLFDIHFMLQGSLLSLREDGLNDQRSHKQCQTDDAKNHQVEDLISLDGRSCGGSCLRSKPTRKLRKEV